MRVLLIEDDDLVRMVLSETLGSDGIEVDGLANAEDALILLGAGQVPDVLVTDVDLGPGINGFDLAEIARSRHPGVQVILISGTVPEEAGQGPHRQSRFFQKPFAPADLAAAIRQAGSQPDSSPGQA
jgi:DNA-binding NtrC family response regulator